jgi:hypothetical protein
MVGEGKGMKDKIAEIIGQARVNSILGLSAGTSEDVKPNDYYADQILALLISNPLWKDIDRNIPSLDGIVVVNECKHHDSLGRNIINRTAKYPCCNGTGEITRQAEWGDIDVKRFITLVTEFATSHVLKNELLKTKSGRLVVREKD